MEQELETAWTHIQEHLREAVTDSAYHIWLAPLRPVALNGSTLYVSAPESIHRWIEERYLGLLRNAAAATTAASTVVIAPAGQDAPPTARALNPKYTFDRFVIGDGNRFAHAAALTVAEAPAEAYNPLFLYGGPGTGKTHLLQAVAWYVGVHGLGLNVLYTTVEAFTDQFVNALRNGTIDAFKSRHRDNDVLLIDDVQFLEHKQKTQEEFFHTIDILHEGGSQVVLSSDRPPRELGLLEIRLRTRFEWGLITALDPPDFGTRLVVLEKQAARDGVAIEDPTVLPSIATRIEDNLRALEGALVRVTAYASLTARAIDAELVEKVLGDLYPRSQRETQSFSVHSIQTAVCEELGVTAQDLVGRSRTARIVQARQIAMYLARELTPSSTPSIGREFGGRDHTTVLHATRRVSMALEQDPSTTHLLTAVKARLEAGRSDPST